MAKGSKKSKSIPASKKKGKGKVTGKTSSKKKSAVKKKRKPSRGQLRYWGLIKSISSYYKGSGVKVDRSVYYEDYRHIKNTYNSTPLATLQKDIGNYLPSRTQEGERVVPDGLLSPFDWFLLEDEVNNTVANWKKASQTLRWFIYY